MRTRSKNTIATPPGETIREQLEDRGMTQKEFAVRMDMSEKHVSHLINGEVRMTPDVAMRLESVLGIPARFWLKLEAIYQEKLARVKMENEMEADEELAKRFPYSEMANYGWVPPTRSAHEKAVNLCAFFQVARLNAIENLVIPGIAYRRTGANEKNNYVLAAWAQQARIEAKSRDVSSVNIARLQDSIPQIRAMTTESPEVFCPRLVSLMSSCGVALIFLPHMNGSFLHGASFFDGSKIVMGMTVRGKDADRFWFSLFHEIAHIVKGHIGKPEGTTEDDEQVADAFAAEVLIPQAELQPFIHGNDFSVSSIKQFAKKINIAEGIVVGRLQKENYIRFNQMHELKQQYVIS